MAKKNAEQVAAYGLARRQKHQALGLCRCGRMPPQEGVSTCRICLALILRSQLFKRYGLSWEEYQERVREQKGLCAICERKPPGRHRLSVDHNHKTKQVRGLLCQRCNVGIGTFDETEARFLQAMEYLRQWGDLK